MKKRKDIKLEISFDLSLMKSIDKAIKKNKENAFIYSSSKTIGKEMVHYVIEFTSINGVYSFGYDQAKQHSLLRCIEEAI